MVEGLASTPSISGADGHRKRPGARSSSRACWAGWACPTWTDARRPDNGTRLRSRPDPIRASGVWFPARLGWNNRRAPAVSARNPGNPNAVEGNPAACSAPGRNMAEKTRSHALRGNAVDAPRRPIRAEGRRAAREAFPRRAWERVTRFPCYIVEIRPYSPIGNAWLVP